MEYSYRDIGNVKILKLSGVIDRYNSQPIRKWLEEATATPPAQIVINLMGVDFLDSNGLAVLVYGYKRAKEAGGSLRLCGLRNSVRILLELTRLDKVFEVYVSEEDAIQAFAPVEQVS